jgi:hypothetical protein
MRPRGDKAHALNVLAQITGEQACGVYRIDQQFFAAEITRGGRAEALRCPRTIWAVREGAHIAILRDGERTVSIFDDDKNFLRLMV